MVIGLRVEGEEREGVADVGRPELLKCDITGTPPQLPASSSLYFFPYTPLRP
jgi:hypothetical protein